MFDTLLFSSDFFHKEKLKLLMTHKFAMRKTGKNEAVEQNETLTKKTVFSLNRRVVFKLKRLFFY